MATIGTICLVAILAPIIIIGKINRTIPGHRATITGTYGRCFYTQTLTISTIPDFTFSRAIDATAIRAGRLSIFTTQSFSRVSAITARNTSITATTYRTFRAITRTLGRTFAIATNSVAIFPDIAAAVARTAGLCLAWTTITIAAGFRASFPTAGHTAVGVPITTIGAGLVIAGGLAGSAGIGFAAIRRTTGLSFIRITFSVPAIARWLFTIGRTGNAGLAVVADIIAAQIRRATIFGTRIFGLCPFTASVTAKTHRFRRFD